MLSSGNAFFGHDGKPIVVMECVVNDHFIFIILGINPTFIDLKGSSHSIMSLLHATSNKFYGEILELKKTE